VPAELRSLLEGDLGARDRGDARFRQQDSIRRYLLSVASDVPLVLVLDDVQWADSSSLQLLAHVVSMSRSGTLLTIALTRPGIDARHEGALIRLDRLGRRLSLDPLDEHALTEMAAAAGVDLPGALLLARTGVTRCSPARPCGWSRSRDPTRVWGGSPRASAT
jgi:hypothetical protein